MGQRDSDEGIPFQEMYGYIKIVQRRNPVLFDKDASIASFLLREEYPDLMRGCAQKEHSSSLFRFLFK